MDKDNIYGPLFETSLSRVLKAAPSRIGDALRNLLDAEVIPVEKLKVQVESHLKKVMALSETAEFVDLEGARKVAAGCLRLLAGITAETSAESCRLIQVAVRYFVD